METSEAAKAAQANEGTVFSGCDWRNMEKLFAYWVLAALQRKTERNLKGTLFVYSSSLCVGMSHGNFGSSAYIEYFFGTLCFAHPIPSPDSAHSKYGKGSIGKSGFVQCTLPSQPRQAMFRSACLVSGKGRGNSLVCEVEGLVAGGPEAVRSCCPK